MGSTATNGKSQLGSCLAVSLMNLTVPVNTLMDGPGDFPLPGWLRDMENHYALGC